MQDKIVPWSSNWWLENDKAWFCSGETGTIFCADMNSGKCEIVAQIPEEGSERFYRYSYCIKYKNNIFCLPYLGKRIWFYDIKNRVWGKIEIKNESYLMFFPASYKQDDRQIWLLEDKTGRLFGVNLVRREVEKEYYIPRNNAFADAYVGEYVRVGNELYCVLGDRIYRADISSTDIINYRISDVKKELYTICFDGNNFWLSGCSKEIYIWNEEQGHIKTITEFPEQFGFYHFKENEIPFLDCDSFFNTEYSLFLTSLSMGKYMWYITCRSNGIIYIDKRNYKVFYLEINDEKETQESIKTNFLGYKFQFLYVRENRYIGIYSVKNQWIFEIDTVDLCVRKKDYGLDDQSILYLAKFTGYGSGQCIFREGRKRDGIVFSTMIGANGEKKEKTFQNVGERIYYTLK